MNTLTLAQQLIARPSVTPDDAGCQLILRQHLEALGFECESLRFGEVDNLFAHYGKKRPLFLFAGHTDVVPPGPENAWISPPFQPTIRDGYLYGRGATDMKSAIAAMVIATQAFIAAHPKFPGSIAFLITSDEEGDAKNGTQKVMEYLQKRGEQIDYCIVGEASSDQTTGDQIRVGRRGSLHGTLLVRGKQGHVAFPHLAHNPIHAALPALTELTQTVWDMGNEYFPATSFQMTNVHSGVGARNVVPGDLQAFLNWRFSNAITIETIEEKTRAIFDSYQLNYQLSFDIGATPFLSKQPHLAQLARETILESTGRTAIFSTGGGTSDGRFIAPVCDNVIELGPPHATAHHVNECVSLQALEELTAIYEKILERVFNIH